MKLLGSTESKITKDENGENVPHLENTEVVLFHCNTVNNDYCKPCMHMHSKSFVVNLLVNYQVFHLKILCI